MNPLRTTPRRWRLPASLFIAALLAVGGHFARRATLMAVHAQSPASTADGAPFGDFNGDGRLDFAYVEPTGGDGGAGVVAVRLGGQGGAFDAPVRYGVGANPSRVRAGDFNADGKTDLAVAHNGDPQAPAAERGPGVRVLLGAGDGTFGARRDTSLADFGGVGALLAAGDFNGDGKLDLIGGRGAAFFVLLGAGDGSFARAANFSVAGRTAASDLAAGDFNRDGKLDLAFANHDFGVTTLAGRGDGTFWQQRHYVTAGNARSVAVGDVDGDGRIDLVAGNSTGAACSVLLNRGDGTFGSRRDYGSAAEVGRIALADLNADGRLDVIAAASVSVTVGNNTQKKDALLVFAGRCFGEFGPQTELLDVGAPQDILAADFNRDGRTDVVAPAVTGTGGQGGTPYNTHVAVLLGVQIGQAVATCPPTGPAPPLSFSGPDGFTVRAQPFKLVKGDFNGDGKLDLAATVSDDRVAVHLGGGDGTFGNFATSEIFAVECGDGLAAADVNGDGKLDLLALDGGVTACLGDGAGRFTPGAPALINSFVTAAALGDFNADGKVDAALAGGNYVALLSGNGDGTFGNRRDVAEFFGSVRGLAAGDFNGDGKADLVAARATDDGRGDSCRVLLGAGDGTFKPANFDAVSLRPVDEPTGGVRPAAVAAGDFNSDGKLDFVVTHAGSNTITVFVNHGNNYFARLLVAVDIAARLTAVELADFNNDGKLDLAGVSDTNHVAVLPGVGDGTFSTNTFLEGGTGPRALAAGDFNSDGKLDLAVTTTRLCDGACQWAVGVYLNRGGNAVVTPTPTPSPTPINVKINVLCRVVDADNRGVAGVKVALKGASQAEALTSIEGWAEFRGVPGGDYEISADGLGAYSISPGPVSFPKLSVDKSVSFTAQVRNPAAVVAATNYAAQALAPDSIVTAFGTRLAASARAAESLPLPTELGGTRVSVTDASGVERAAPLFYVSPTQVNFQMPAGLGVGARAVVKITGGDGTVSVGEAEITAVAPGLFSADATGGGVAAAVVQRVKADGSQAYEPVAEFDGARGRFAGLPIDLGPDGERVYLLLYGTGLRARSSVVGVRAFVGARQVSVAYAGAQGVYAGLDQVNLLLPRALAGAGEVEVWLSVDGAATNRVKVRIK